MPGACVCKASPDPASNAKPQHAGHTRSRHPAHAAYARAEQVPTNCPQKHRSRRPNMLVSVLCIRNEARATPVLGGWGSRPSHDHRVMNPKTALVTGLALCSRLGTCLTQRNDRDIKPPEQPRRGARYRLPVNPLAGAPRSSRRRATGARRSAGGPDWRSSASDTAQPRPRSMRRPRRSADLGSWR